MLNYDYLALLQIEETASEEATVPIAADHNKGTFVPIGSSKEQDKLKMKLINSAKEKFSDQKVQTTSREECALYAETRSCHPTSKSVHIKQLVCCSTVECWKRADNRVSKELMTAKFNFGVEEITVEHHPATGGLKKKVVASIAQVMGAQVSLTEITFDLAGSPKLFNKLPERGSIWKESHLQKASDKLTDSGNGSSVPVEHHDCHRVQIHLADNKREDIGSLLEHNASLKRAIERGLCSNYPQFQMLEENPAKYFPIVKDPTLVKAAQNALLEILHLCTNTRSLTQYYAGLESQFNELLSLRQSSAK